MKAQKCNPQAPAEIARACGVIRRTDVKQLIGVDLGGTSLRAARMDTGGHILQHHSVATAATAGPEAVAAQIVALVEQVMGDISRSDIQGVGIGSPGPLDPFEGVVFRAPNLKGWVDVPLRAMLEKGIGLPVVLGNDGNAAALGEWHMGSGKGCRDFIYIGLGTGIGGGIITNGQLLLGRKGAGGEVGHIQIEGSGPVCGCGQVGCWEAFASGVNFARWATETLQSQPESALYAQATAGKVTPADIFAAAVQGDAPALDCVRREGEYIGRGLVSLLHLFSPERIALGGGVMAGAALLEPHVRRVIETQAMEPFRDVEIVYAHHGEHAGVIGAAALLLS
jgi:glucokinase